MATPQALKGNRFAPAICATMFVLSAAGWR